MLDAARGNLSWANVVGCGVARCFPFQIIQEIIFHCHLLWFCNLFLYCVFVFATGNGTSAITLILNAKQDINLTNKMLTEEYGTASCIKSRVNRLSVLSAITSTQQRLKKYNRTPPNGLIIFCGEVLTEAGRHQICQTEMNWHERLWINCFQGFSNPQKLLVILYIHFFCYLIF